MKEVDKTISDICELIQMWTKKMEKNNYFDSELDQYLPQMLSALAELVTARACDGPAYLSVGGSSGIPDIME